MNKLSFVGIAFGLVIAISSWIRYFILWPDMDKALFFGLIGLLVIAVSWNYAGRVYLKDRIEKLENTLTQVEEWIVDKQEEKEEEE